MATPQKSLAASPPVATIGGEPDGRGAIVVQDLGQAPNVPQGEQTNVDAGKAEPGRDIFAPAPKGDVKSENNVISSFIEDNEPKAISVIGLSSHSDVLPMQDETALEKPVESAPAISHQDGSPSPSGDASSPTSSEVVKAKVQGPMDAEQAEADEVRQELFPDANS